MSMLPRLTYKDFIHRFEDPYVNKRRKVVKSDAIGGDFAGFISKESTQNALDAFHSIGSGVTKAETKSLLEQLTSKKTFLKFSITDPTIENCENFRNENKFNILDSNLNIFSDFFYNDSFDIIYILDDKSAIIYGITKDSIIKNYEEFEYVGEFEGKHHFKNISQISKKNLGIPLLLTNPNIPKNVEIESSDIINEYEIIDTHEYKNKITDVEMFYPIDDLIAFGYLIGSKHIIWTFGKPTRLIRHKYGDLIGIKHYVNDEYKIIICDFSNIDTKTDISQKTYIKLHDYENVIKDSIFITNLAPAWFSLYCVNHFENYRSCLYIIRDILEFEFETLYQHKMVTLHLISEGFRKYSNQDFSTLTTPSATVSLFTSKATASVKKSIYTSPLVMELTGKKVNMKHPYDFITNIPRVEL